MALSEQELVQLENRPKVQPFPGAENFKPNFIYSKDTVIFHNNVQWRARDNFRSNDNFNAANWEQIAVNANDGNFDVQGVLTENGARVYSENNPQPIVTDGITITGGAMPNNPLRVVEGKFISPENLTQGLANEASARTQGITEAVGQEAAIRQGQINQVNNILNGIKAMSFSGALLTRVINGITPVQKSLFDTAAAFIIRKTLVSDANGTIGVCIGEVDSATINIETLSVSPISRNEPTLLGTVTYNANLPLNIDTATAMGWNTPRVDDYAQVLRDETMGSQRVEWYVTDIVGGNIIWGNPVIINTGDYQSQTTASDSGKVLTGGASAGTFGKSIPIDVTPTVNSGNLITSGAVFKYGFVEIEHDDLLALIAGNRLTVGTLYKITDYKTVYIQPETNLDSSLTPAIDTQPEPLIVIATSPNTLDVKAYSPLFPQDEIWYDVVKNNTARYQWATPNDKGQIFRRITTNKNDFPYDVRNIKFRRWALDFSPFLVWNANNVTYNPGDKVVYNDTLFLVIAQFTTSSSYPVPDAVAGYITQIAVKYNAPLLPNNRQFIVRGNTNITINILDNDYIDYYTFDRSGSQIDGTTVHANCVNIYSASGIRRLNNSVFKGNNFYSNTIGNNFQNNTIGNNFYSNTIGNNFQNNTIGNNFYYNTIGNYFYRNRFGDGFAYNDMSTYSSAVSEATSVRNNVFENGISFTSTKNWGTADDAILRSDNTAVYGRYGSNVLRHQFTAGAVTMTQVV